MGNDVNSALLIFLKVAQGSLGLPRWRRPKMARRLVGNVWLEFYSALFQPFAYSPAFFLSFGTDPGLENARNARDEKGLSQAHVVPFAAQRHMPSEPWVSCRDDWLPWLGACPLAARSGCRGGLPNIRVLTDIKPACNVPQHSKSHLQGLDSAGTSSRRISTIRITAACYAVTLCQGRSLPSSIMNTTWLFVNVI